MDQTKSFGGKLPAVTNTDDGETHIETPEEGAEFEIYLKSAGSYGNADPDERDVIVCDENGFGQTKDITSFDNSKWYSKWDEKDVFRLELKDEQNNYTLRIGKGGQIYSIETPIGEIMPPQNREHAWVDDITTITVQQYDQNMVEPDVGNLYNFTGFIL